jgi:hypothetical protein
MSALSYLVGSWVSICTVLVGSLGSTSTALVSSIGQKALDKVSSLWSAMPSTTVSWSLLSSAELATAVLPAIGIRLLEGAAHRDDAVRSLHLRLEVVAVGDRHKHGIARTPEDGMVRNLKFHNLEDQGLGTKVATVTERD